MPLPTPKEEFFQEEDQSGDPFDLIRFVSHVSLAAYVVGI